MYLFISGIHGSKETVYHKIAYILRFLIVVGRAEILPELLCKRGQWVHLFLVSFFSNQIDLLGDAVYFFLFLGCWSGPKS
uniref:Uncharacterized protein n=1 Tax=Trichogramma kaykai TaxID=54128 RepID=A0ABD2X3E5_9HYME